MVGNDVAYVETAARFSEISPRQRSPMAIGSKLVDALLVALLGVGGILTVAWTAALFWLGISLLSLLASGIQG